MKRTTGILLLGIVGVIAIACILIFSGKGINDSTDCVIYINNADFIRSDMADTVCIDERPEEQEEVTDDIYSSDTDTDFTDDVAEEVIVYEEPIDNSISDSGDNAWSGDDI